MNYGTITTDVQARYRESGGDFIRWLIVTSWLPTDEKDPSCHDIKWETHLTYIDRLGNIQDIESGKWMDMMRDGWHLWLKNHHVESMLNGYSARCEMRVEHDKAIEVVIG